MIKTTDDPLILIDGSSYLYRAYHAFPPLNNDDGKPTGALYGVLNMIRSLLLRYHPSHIAIIFDAKGKTVRHALYAEYKSHRPAMPDDLVTQIQPLYQIIDAMGLSRLVIDKVEADDVIGTLACMAASQGKTVLISSGDKDMTQLVSSKITLINTMNNITTDLKRVYEKYGIKPGLIIDLLALMGDSSDNIPGVPGIGEKRALSLLQSLGDLKEIYANLDKISTLNLRGTNSIIETLNKNRELAFLSYRLATINTNVCLDITPSELVPRAPDFVKLRHLFEYYQFKQWLAAAQENMLFSKISQPSKPPIVQSQLENYATQSASDCEVILNESTFIYWITKLKSEQIIVLNCEIERTDRVNIKLLSISFTLLDGKTAYIPCYCQQVSSPLDYLFLLKQLKPLLEDKQIGKIGHDFKIIQQILARHDIKLHGIIFDTMLASYILNSTANHQDLSALNKLYFKDTNYVSSIIDEIKNIKTYKNFTVYQLAQIRFTQNLMILKLYNELWPKFQQNSTLLNLMLEIELPLSSVLARMESLGVLIDSAMLLNYSKQLSVQLKTLEDKAYLLAGTPFNLASPKQLQHVLFTILGLPCIKKTPSGIPSTNETVLSQLAINYPLPALLLQHRTLSKLKSTYTDTLPRMVDPETGRVHTFYHQTVTSTGRLSSSDPNLQNIPIRAAEGRRIRQAFVAPPKYQIVSADYSHIELRIMAHLSGDHNLTQAFLTDHDVHRITAAEVFNIPLSDVTQEQRRRAKAINFGLIYGMSSFGLARQLKISYERAESYLSLYFKRYPGVLDYMNNIRQVAAKKGYVETIFGRRLYLPEINSPNQAKRKAAERAAINAPMQGSAADIIKQAMIKIDRWLQEDKIPNIKMIMQVHDELVFEVDQSLVEHAIEQIIHIMQHSVQLTVPLKVVVGLGTNWDIAHS